MGYMVDYRQERLMVGLVYGQDEKSNRFGIDYHVQPTKDTTPIILNVNHGVLTSVTVLDNSGRKVVRLKPSRVRIATSDFATLAVLASVGMVWKPCDSYRNRAIAQMPPQD